MSAHKLVLSEYIFSSKEEALKASQTGDGTLAATRPGISGWCWKTATELEEMVCVKHKVTLQVVWVPAAEHRQDRVLQKEENKRRNPIPPLAVRKSISAKRRQKMKENDHPWLWP